MSAKTPFEACGISVALTFSYTWEQLAPNHIEGLYLHALPVHTVAGGAALDLVAVSLLGWGALALLEHFDRAGKTLIWVLMIGVVPAVLLRTVLLLAEVNFRVPSATELALVPLIPAGLAWYFRPAAYRKLVACFRFGYLCAGVCVLWMLPQLIHSAMHVQHDEAMTSGQQTGQGDSQGRGYTGQPRIIWVLLDELSYDQTFAHRQPAEKLPGFDTLRAESASFGDVQPTGYYTDYIVPALLRGRPVGSIRSSLDGELSVRESPNGPWEHFDPQSTLFADAERLGWNTAIAGWFNPYCRLFAQIVNSCLWVPQSRMFPGHMSSANAAWQNALAPFMSKFRADAETMQVNEHHAAYSVLLKRSLQLVDDPSERFLYLHFPIPHPPGMYDRVSGKQRNGGSYLDNLALADETVQVLRAAIDRTPAAPDTILIVSSDHSMRVLKWRGGLYWTAEDERVLHNRFDPRPVLMVHFPGEQTEQAVSAPFSEIKTHDLIEEMLRGKMNSTSDLERWLRVNGTN
jgi:hypothetical protein